MNSLWFSERKPSFLWLVMLLFGAGCEAADSHCHTGSHQEGVIGFYEERDLELFSSLNGSHQGIFYQAIAGTSTSWGKDRLTRHLKKPVTDILTLQSRQRQLAVLLHHPELLTEVNDLLAIIAANEDGLRSLLDNVQDPVTTAALNNFYFQSSWLTQFNTSSVALDAGNYAKYVALLEPFFHYAIFHVAMDHAQEKVAHKHEHTHVHNHVGHGCSCPHHHDDRSWFFSLLKGGDFAWHLSSYPAIFQQLQAERNLIQALHNQVGKARLCLSAIKKLYILMQQYGYNAQAFGLDTQAYNALLQPAMYPELHTFIDDTSFDGQSSLHFYSRIGTTLSYYKLLKQQQLLLQTLVTGLGDIDALTAVASWYTSVNADMPRACLVNFVEATDTPCLELQGVWNIAFDANRVVTNDINLNASKALNGIITGPNKAGKSSIIKAVGYAVILAQTYGIAPAQIARMTPFSKLISHITIVDDIARNQSRMMAEKLRADCCLHALHHLPPQQYVCVLIDDSLFKGTTEEKSNELAYEFIENIGQVSQCCSLVATHMPVLTTFAQQLHSSFKNYCIDITVDSRGRSRSTFKLKEGIADPHTVFDIIESE